MELILGIIVVVLDQISKFYIQNNAGVVSGTEVIPNFFYINYVKNTGAAWSMLSGKTTFLALISVVAIGVMLYFLMNYKKKGDKLVVYALTLMISGALGNLFDRLYFNYVRDFLDFYIFGYDFPVFNVADMALTIGVCLLIIATLMEDNSKDTKNE